MLPAFDPDGKLPPGVHWATWQEFTRVFGATPHRKRLIKGLAAALDSLRAAGCRTVYVDGSFVTAKEAFFGEPPGDYGACWDMNDVDPTLLDPILLIFDSGRATQKAKYLGEFFPSHWPAGASDRTFFNFFQIDKDTGNPKGIIALGLRRLP